MGFDNINMDLWQPNSFLVLTTTAGITSFIVLFKHWLHKQQEWMQAEKEKVIAELQLLKAQVHPHFLFNTLNNIYSFSVEHSPKTPALILKLSSMLSYILYECNEEKVMLAKEIEIMKNYVDLEKERYGNRIDISWSVEGELENKYIAPLLFLPFIENAFKHGISDQIENPWLSFDMVVGPDKLKCKIVNSKNDFNCLDIRTGIGIENVRKRLAFIYPFDHELKLTDEGNFFVVSLLLKFEQSDIARLSSAKLNVPSKKVSL
jgi:LytS/YehU family sensor histidine kinase